MGLLAGVATALLGGCGSTQKFRYRMTVEVETPQGLRTGFAVREIIPRTPPPLPALGESRPRWDVRGEAVVVDLGGGRTLFALLTGRDGYVDYAGKGVSTIFRVMDRDVGPRGGPHELWPKVPVIREPITDPLPLLVRFGDVADPASVEEVKPDALDRTFGAGVRLRRIAIEATNEAVTTGIGDRLGWLSSSAIMDNPGWAKLPLESRKAINGLFSGTIGERK